MKNKFLIMLDDVKENFDIQCFSVEQISKTEILIDGEITIDFFTEILGVIEPK